MSGTAPSPAPTAGAPPPATVVYVVDDDRSVRRALGRLLSSAGRRATAFDSAEAFLAGHDPAAPGCAILDLALPGMDGLALQRRLAEGPAPRQVIFLTGRAAIPDSVRAMKAGAVDFLMKPVEAPALRAAVEDALVRDARARRRAAAEDTVSALLADLSPREREVMALVASGRLNKQIAHDLGIAEKTAKVHRARMMRKMGVRSVADLVRLVATRVG